MRLRFATPDDMPDIVGLGRIMHEESSFAPMNFDSDRVKETIGDLMEKNQFVVVAEDINGEIVGGLAGFVEQSWFGNDDVANDLALFIHPDHRGGFLAARLVKVFVKWAKLAGAKQIRPGVISGCELAEKLYERIGFKRCGSTFVMEGD